MPRPLPCYSDFFDPPLTEDVEELLARFQHTDSVRFEAFSAIWRQMSFSEVFFGVPRTCELKRFCRITLATAVKYFLPPYSYQIRVGGLYLMFGFYHTQLVDPPVKIRLALKDWAAVQRFLRDSVDSGHQDVIYIYQKLVAAKAFHYTAMPHLLTFQKQRKPKKVPVCAEFLGRTSAVQDLLSADILEEVNNIQSHYEEMKDRVKVNCQVNMTHQNVVTRLKETMLEFITWQQKTFSKGKEDKNSADDDEEEKTAEAESSSRARLLSSIKQKSYRNVKEAPKSRRHRQAELVDSSSSGVEHVREAAPHKRRPPSLRARTWKSLGLMEDEKITAQAWLLSAPEQHEKMPVRKTSQVA